MTGLLATLLFLGDLHYRWIGPAVMGGRLDSVAGVAGNPKIVYLGHASGGLWKSTDGGLTFSSAFETGSSSAIGAIAIDPRDANRVYVGTGEPFPRNTADAGDGLWSTGDGGKHWHVLGLRKSASIARIAIDPSNSRVIFAAAMGSEYTPGGERGVYRSNDGGAHWKLVLSVNATTGASDVAIDPRRPSVVYAGMYDFQRKPWTFRSGGAGSGLYRSANGGRTWTRLTSPGAANGLPASPIDRVGVSICASDPRVVYAFVPNRAGLLYRSIDDGAHWSMRSASESIDFRPFYFSQVRCDPGNPEKVYALAGGFNVSTDGGRRFKDMPDSGGDNHDLWIDPSDPDRLLDASDMGFRYSVSGGRTWNNDNVVPFAQIYHAGYDFDQPYHVMGGLQDHEVWRGPNTLYNTGDGVSGGDWTNIADWGDGQYAVQARNGAYVFEDTHFGDLVRMDPVTGQRQYISPWPAISFGGPAGASRYRFNWSAPVLVSPRDVRVVYFGANVLFRSADAGNTWVQFSPDLTQCRPEWIGNSGGPVTQDYTNAETYCTITAIGEDRTDPKSVWYGTDTGHVLVTSDAGGTWSDVTPHIPGVAPGGRVTSVTPDLFTSGMVYVAFDRHQFGDDRPYVYQSGDRGRTWEALGKGLEGYVHVIRADPYNRYVLYAGTERGIYVSLDEGRDWFDLRLGLPHMPVYDVQVQPDADDLIVATHGRGFYILDDLTPLQQQHGSFGVSVPVLFAPRAAVRYPSALPYHEHGRGEFVAENKPYGALITAFLPKVPPPSDGKSRVRVHVYAGTKEIDAFWVRVHRGFNRFTWDLQTQAPGPVQDPRAYYVFYPMSIQGPQVVPGDYTLTVDAPGGALTVPVTVVYHGAASTADLQRQYDALVQLAAVQERAEAAIARLTSIEKRIGRRAQVDALLDRLRNPDPSGYRRPARISEQIAYLRNVIQAYDGAPTAAQLALAAEYAQEMDGVESDIAALMKTLAVNAQP